MKPRIVVVDTNVVVSGLISSEQDSPTSEILDGMLEGRSLFLLSVELISSIGTYYAGRQSGGFIA